MGTHVACLIVCLCQELPSCDQGCAILRLLHVDRWAPSGRPELVLRYRMLYSIGELVPFQNVLEPLCVLHAHDFSCAGPGSKIELDPLLRHPALIKHGYASHDCVPMCAHVTACTNVCSCND